MKSNYKFIIIDQSGKEYDPSDFIKKPEIDEDFKILLQREVLGISANSRVGESDVRKSLAYNKPLERWGIKWEKNSPIGFASYDYKADILIRLAKEYARMQVNKIGIPIFEVSGSVMFDLSHPVVESYAKLYGSRLFKLKASGKSMVMSYDASYPQFGLASDYQLSYRNLPFGHFSIADCYRNEQSGECMLLARSRRFFMPDFHPYFADMEESLKWFLKIAEVVHQSAAACSRQYVVCAEVSSELEFEKHHEFFESLAKENNGPVLIKVNKIPKNSYWIMNVDYNIIDELSQVREIACIQVDVGNAERLKISYKNSEGRSKRPVIIHSAVSGGIDRFLYMALDQYPKYLPFWLYPVQLRFIPVNEVFNRFCEDLSVKLESHNIRAEVDDRNLRVGRKLISAKEDLIPKSVVIGEKEVSEFNEIGELAYINKLINSLNVDWESIEEYPYLKMSWPRMVSKQVG